MSEERITALTLAYKESAIELRIFFESLICEGFSRGEAIDIIVTVLARLDSVNSYRRDRERTIEKSAFAEFIKSRAAAKEKEKEDN